MKSKLNIPFLALVITAGLYGCGSSASNNADNASSETTTTSSSAEAVIDVNAKSDSKGIGRFTKVDIGPVDAAMAKKGGQVFQLKCSACHKTTDEKLVGPGLKGITGIRTPEWIMNMITNPGEMTQKDPVAKALLEQNLTQMSVQVEDGEARQILEYLRANDAAQ